MRNGLRMQSCKREEVDNATVDWSAWDDTYTFITDENAAYRQATLVNESLANIRPDRENSPTSATIHTKWTIRAMNKVMNLM
jgi:hypothetical protein